MINDDLTILIQGRCSDECLDLQNKNYYSYNVIYSLWDDSSVEISNSNSVKVIISTKPKESGPQNLFLQVVSTLNGLLQVKTKYCIKMRADEYVSNIEYIMESVERNTEMLHTLPVFFRPYHLYKFHCSDHLIAGTTENLLLMFQTCYDKILLKNWKSSDFTNPEMELTRTYLEQKEKTDISEKRHLMRQYFNILDINSVKPYIIVANGMKKKFYDNFDPQKNDSITNLDNY